MKQKIRAEILEKRRNISKEEFFEKSREIIDSLKSLPEFKKAKNILFYVSFDNEVDTLEIIDELLDNQEKKVIVPYIKKGEINVSELKDFSELKNGKFGIPEPGKIRKFDEKDLDLVIVPGIAFDNRGYRIGYGYGCYDQFLKKIECIKVGLFFEIQLIKKVPQEKHDVALDFLITEKRILKV